jgi:hypothetical protein
LDSVKYIIKKKISTAFVYRIGSLVNINKFIKIFDEAQLLGAKALDYRDFKIGIENYFKKITFDIRRTRKNKNYC